MKKLNLFYFLTSQGFAFVCINHLDNSRVFIFVVVFVVIYEVISGIACIKPNSSIAHPETMDSPY
ncbi:hypothetical protein ABE288_03150 [Bacillus salipaludis]|uniref:hypothetical protein n=1 Tax=Bacillus salipaludis TaxID=2547811 RepID=UPI003D230A65